MSSRQSTSTTHLALAPTVPQAVHALAAPVPALVDAQLPTYLLPATLDLLRSSAAHVVQQRRREEQRLRAEGLLPGRQAQDADEDEDGDGDGALVEAELAKRVERIGLMVGGYIAEKLTLARAPLGSQLDIVKFVCKDLFLYVYSKQIDNLRTNHRGVYVLQSHAFPPLVPISSTKGPAADLEAARPHLVFPQALIQGALQRLGMHASVTTESSGLPQCTFQIRTLPKPGPAGAGTPAVPAAADSTPSTSANNPDSQHRQSGHGLGIAT